MMELSEVFTTREYGDNILIMILYNDTGDQFWAESSTRHTSLESVESPWSPDDGNCKDAEVVVSFFASSSVKKEEMSR